MRKLEQGNKAVVYGWLTVSGLHFESLHAMLNGTSGNGGSGLTTGGAVEDLAVNGGEFTQNTFGIYLNQPVNGFRVIGATIGAGAGYATGNANWGVVIAPGSSGIVVTNNDLRGNFLGSVADNSGQKTNDFISGNLQ